MSVSGYTKVGADAKFGVAGLPSYAPAGLVNRYDPIRNAYNWKASNTRRLRAGLAKAASGGEAGILTIGDSITAGCTNNTGPVMARTQAWPLAMGSSLSQVGIPCAGTGVVRLVDASLIDSRITYAGAWSNPGADTFTVASGATVTLTTNKAGTAVSVWYDDSPSAGGFTVSVNGASSGGNFLTVAGGGTLGWKRATITGVTGLAVGSTVTVTSLSTTIIILAGIEVYTPNGGLTIHNVAQSGSTASGSGSSSWADSSSGNYNRPIWTAVPWRNTPSAVFIALGTNDMNGGASAAAAAAGIQSLAGAFTSSDIILVAPPQPGELTIGQWTPLLSALYTVAETLNVPLVDMHDRLGGYAAEAANGLTGDVLAHLNVAAYSDWGRNLALLAAS